jgi:hypothetical protein
MKRSIHVFLGALLTAIFLAACAPAFEPELGTDYTRQQEETEKRYFTIAITSPAPSALPPNLRELKVQPASGAITDQVIRIDTTAYVFGSTTGNGNFNLVIGEDGTIPGIGVYTVSEASSSEGTWGHGTTSLGYTAVYIDKNTVELHLPFPGGPDNTVKKDRVIFIADADAVRFNGEGRLNMDRDTVTGEGNSKGFEDNYFEYFHVLDNTLVTPSLTVTPVGDGNREIWPSANTLSVPNSPDSTDTTLAYIWEVGGTKLVLGTFSDTAGEEDNFSETALTNAFRFQKFDHAGKTWVTASHTGSLDKDTGKLTLTFSTGSALYDVYRYQVRLYDIAEQNPVYGYIHRASYISYDATKDPNAGFTNANGTAGAWTVLPSNAVVNRPNKDAARIEFVPVTSTTGFSATPGGDTSSGYYIDVEIPNTSGSTNQDAVVDPATITATNIKAFYNPTSSSFAYGQLYEEIALTDASFEKRTTNSRAFRINLPATFKPSNDSNGRVQVRIHGVEMSYTVTVSGEKETRTARLFDINNTACTVNIVSAGNF